MGIELAGGSASRGRVGPVGAPSPAAQPRQGLEQVGQGGASGPFGVDAGEFGGEQVAFDVEDVEAAGDACIEPPAGRLQGLLQGGGAGAFGGRASRAAVWGSQGVAYVLEGVGDGLFVLGRGLIAAGFAGFDAEADAAGVPDGLRRRRQRRRCRRAR